MQYNSYPCIARLWDSF